MSDDQMPYGVNTIRLRISFPAAPVLRGYNGRAWKMRPLRGWTGGQAARPACPEGEAVAPFGLDTTGVQRDQAFGDGLARDVRFALGAQQWQGEAFEASFIQQAELGGRSDAGLFRERYQTAADQALAALEAVNALPIGQRFAANSPTNTATDAGSAFQQKMQKVFATPDGSQASVEAYLDATPETDKPVLDVQFTTNYDYACKSLGVDKATAREAIHTAKRRLKLGARDDCTFDLKTGDILWQGEIIGNLFGD